MREAEAMGVQELSREPEVSLRAVLRVTGDRQVDRGEVDANLMRPSGFQPHVE
jgi:hypothetical protein